MSWGYRFLALRGPGPLVPGSGSQVPVPGPGFGLRVPGPGFRVLPGWGFRVLGSGSGPGSRGAGSRVRVRGPGPGSQVPCAGFGSGFWIRGPGSGCGGGGGGFPGNWRREKRYYGRTRSPSSVGARIAGAFLGLWVQGLGFWVEGFRVFGWVRLGFRGLGM